MVCGWLVLAATCYPSLWGKDGAGLFKLDAWIYYHAVAQWHAGGSLYDWYANPADHLWPFTYPPFAAAVLTPLTWGSDRLAQVVLVLATPACAALTSWAVLRALGTARTVARGAAPWLAAGGVIVLEPLPKTMEYGQVNAVLMAMVALDLLVVPERSRWRGVLSGLAAAFKLTPAIAVLVLLARRELRAAATMALTSLGVTALCWLVWPAESAEFFGSAMWDPGRAGLSDYSGNQNLMGLVARWLPEDAWRPVWALASLVVVLAAMALLVSLTPQRWGRAPGRLLRAASPRGPADGTEGGAREEDGLVMLLGLVIAMTTGLLVSPITWSHHWVWCLPLLVALTAAAHRWASPALWVTALAGAAVFALAMQWWFPEQNHVEQDWPVWAGAVGSSYTWFALAAGAVLWRELRGLHRPDGAPGTEEDGAQRARPTSD
ncbi:Polyprenol-phosphate-mannose-dependent alpha-(1-2)-phosphatidylinositol mannoside mannosyltransferase [Actinomyces howellii]|uniref:Polyprenol-phosphate-mannose-dependent alpha-(1-2)-phosphatidylinositol mannoside mannosyltransferase n=2 Tax=Actinomyces howellii TaxID=52771 RepID=A0A3S4RB02_9ACTO|nr:glycosyltransferase 87 family protein [Actinomyces howellii]VEG28296.1 Polyprenol-phosphate-mannose-dependent alpha-(1-2)-phosphatidylinositol mannoside mannosyltransferase [Actinomyces howellii]